MTEPKPAQPDEHQHQEPEKKEPVKAGDIRKAGYFFLFLAAVFVVNAMETGSYRTPWPVAIVVLVVGVGLTGYSIVKERQG